ncbi:ParB/RepB/Spo0J family partition protein [Mesorhizobium sp.]|uniref:ParB/RepB/Spo0J family partition protein n=1 Tax=Mesorhizobium sp. TaxID=1871066 RepID=UPI0025BE72A5|nr:ParB/RepB/Spo0J family partition protein [Mesorhizobium sp.]
MEPAQRLIEELEKEWTEQQTILRRWREDGVKFDLERPEKLDIRAISLVPELFQPRDGISEKHVADLTKAIKNVGELDPLTVIVVGRRTILIDGHHRVEAYGRAKWGREVAVRYFDGSPSAAVLAASEANSAVKLPMESRERQNRAWKLVLIGRYSKPEIARAAGVSERQVANMRSVVKQLGDEAFAHSKSWFRARNAAKGGYQNMDEAEASVWQDELAQRYADGMAKMFSTKMADNPQVAAMALEKYFGRRLPEVWRELRDFVDVREIELEDAAEEAAVEAEEFRIGAVAKPIKTPGPDEASRRDEF